MNPNETPLNTDTPEAVAATPAKPTDAPGPAMIA